MTPDMIMAIILSLVQPTIDTIKENSKSYQRHLIKIKEQAKLLADETMENKSTIPQEYIQEPNDSIVLPALQTSIYYLNEDNIRTLFAKLLASAFDCRKSESLHPGFIEIIKQLSPMDVRILCYLHDSPNFNGISAIKNNQEYLLIETSLIKNIEDVDQISFSIENLIRLRLIHVDRRCDISFEDENSDVVVVSTSSKLDEKSNFYKLLCKEYSLRKVNAYLTVFGKNFLKVCVD